MTVKLCGPVLASIFYDHSCCFSDQEGLLLGQIITQKSDAISDSQISSVKEVTSLYVYGFIPCKSSHSWYDASGKVCKKSINTLLKDHSFKDIIGWYKFRRNSSLVVSMRERTVHKSLKSVIPDIEDGQFLFLLCGMQMSLNRSTHSLDHMFYVQPGRKFYAMSSEVVNLGDTAHNEYKMLPSVNVNSASNALVSKKGKKSKKDSSIGSCVADITMATNKVTTNLTTVCEKLNSTEVELDSLRKEIKEIKAKLKQKEDHLKASHKPLPDVPIVSVPKIKLEKPQSYDSGGRAKRLSSGSSSSPSSRKILDFENQESRFDVLRNSSGASLSGNVSLQDDAKACITNEVSQKNADKPHEDIEDLICLDDDVTPLVSTSAKSARVAHSDVTNEKNTSSSLFSQELHNPGTELRRSSRQPKTGALHASSDNLNGSSDHRSKNVTKENAFKSQKLFKDQATGHRNKDKKQTQDFSESFSKDDNFSLLVSVMKDKQFKNSKTKEVKVKPTEDDILTMDNDSLDLTSSPEF